MYIAQLKFMLMGTATGQWATNERDTRANIITTKEDLGNGKVDCSLFP